MPADIPVACGSVITDYGLGRLPEFDARSRQYPIRTLLPTRPLRSYTWSCPVYLDQGSEGACVGFAWAHELAARPAVRPVDTALAMQLYRDAQRADEWDGEGYEGTSVLAGAKTVQAGGYMRQYRWGFGLDDVLMTLAYLGPVVLGVPWFEGMFTPDEEGWLWPVGPVVGGHAILARGVNVKTRSVLLHNSWGLRWGWPAVPGCARIGFAELGRLLAADGEACVPLQRVRGR